MTDFHRVMSTSIQAFVVLFCVGCSTYSPWLPSAGPSREQIQRAEGPTVVLADVDDATARRLAVSRRGVNFGERLGAGGAVAAGVGPGDVLEVSIWEAPPATLFGGGAMDSPRAVGTSRGSALPDQMVNAEGRISVPFVGSLLVAGKSLAQIEEEIAARLRGKANQPQVLVRITRNATSNVTVVGEVAASQRVPLTPRGERLLDALAAAGGVKQPVGKLSVQITRGEKVLALPLDTIIRDPKQNVVLQAGDVLTVLHQPNSFTVLGATGRNEEVNFEAQGISLAQALARSGGLNDARADASGVFVFRFEEGDALDWPAGVQRTPDGRVPVVYRADLKNPATFLAAQNFPVKDKDLLYVSNASGAELQKFLNIVLSAAYPVLNVINMTR